MSKKSFYFIICCLFSVKLFAQTGIGTITPNASAKLDVFADNKGFLPPRVSLSSITDQSTILSPATGLLVYCKGDAGLSAGYYFWNGTAWATIATAGGSGSVAAEYGEQFLTTNVSITSATPVDVISFTLPSAGTWEVISFMRAQGVAGFAAEFGIFDASGTIVPNSEIICAYAESASTGTGVIRITTNGAATYKLKAYASNSLVYNAYSDYNGRTGVTWKKISGNAPVTGQSVDYISTLLTASQTNLAAGQVIKFQTVKAGNIPYNASTGYFSLTAGKTYRLTGFASLDGTASSAGAIDIVWRDQNGNDLSSWGSFMSPSYSSNYAGQGVVSSIYTPTSNISVYLCISYTSVSSNIVRAYATSAQIEQIGSSAIVNPWTLSGTNTYNTTGNVGIGTNAPATTLDVTGDVNVTGKVTVTDPSGSVATKAAAFVARGTDVTLGNLKVRFAASGNMSLQVSTVSGTYSVYGSHTLVSSAIAYNAIDGASPLSITTTPTYLNSGNNFGGAGNIGIWYIMDTGAAISWRISMIVGSGYSNNFISIERLL